MPLRLSHVTSYIIENAANKKEKVILNMYYPIIIQVQVQHNFKLIKILMSKKTLIRTLLEP